MASLLHRLCSVSRPSHHRLMKNSLAQCRTTITTTGNPSSIPLSLSLRSFASTSYFRREDPSRTFATPGTTLNPRQSDRAREIFTQFAFAFDIDGVLYQGKNGIPGAREGLRKLRQNDIRYVFLTNGGGSHEDGKAKSLAKRLKMDDGDHVIRDRVILSHTPMRGWSEEVKRGTVLITGAHPDTARGVAEDYGFAHAITPSDILAANPTIYPFESESFHSVSRSLPKGKELLMPKDPYSKDVSSSALKIDKILVWNDPRDWSVDIQLIYDLLISHRGYFGTISDRNGNTALPNNGWQQDGQPELWISNLDLLWRTEYPVNRFGTGAFVEALKGVWSASTDGTPLIFHNLGKPCQTTYEYAHERLLNYYQDMRLGSGKRTPLKRVYMIGDNPESDIRGANEFGGAEGGTEWRSILVRTGVWKKTALELEPKYKPSVIVDDVVDAIVWAMREEGIDVGREWVLSEMA